MTRRQANSGQLANLGRAAIILFQNAILRLEAFEDISDDDDCRHNVTYLIQEHERFVQWTDDAGLMRSGRESLDHWLRSNRTMKAVVEEFLKNIIRYLEAAIAFSMEDVREDQSIVSENDTDADSDQTDEEASEYSVVRDVEDVQRDIEIRIDAIANAIDELERILSM